MKIRYHLRIVLPFFLCVSHCLSDFPVMPHGFEDIHLGMDWKTIISVRKGVEILNFAPDPDKNLVPDPDKPLKGLVEKIPNGELFDQVIYGFENGLLTSTMFGKSLRENSTGRNDLLDVILSMYGNPSNIEMMPGVKGHGIVVWEQDSIRINAILPAVSDSEDNGKDLISLQIMTREVAEKLKSLYVKSDNDSSKSDITIIDQELLNSLENEIADRTDRDQKSDEQSLNFKSPSPLPSPPASLSTPPSPIQNSSDQIGDVDYTEDNSYEGQNNSKNKGKVIGFIILVVSIVSVSVYQICHRKKQ